MKYKLSNLEKSDIFNLYEKMLKSRMIEEKMLILLRQGKISKWFSGIGQEAISAGVVAALDNDEYIANMNNADASANQLNNQELSHIYCLRMDKIDQNQVLLLYLI